MAQSDRAHTLSIDETLAIWRWQRLMGQRLALSHTCLGYEEAAKVNFSRNTKHFCDGILKTNIACAFALPNRYIYMYIHTYIYIYIHIWQVFSQQLYDNYSYSMYVCVYACVYVCVYACVYACDFKYHHIKISEGAHGEK